MNVIVLPIEFTVSGVPVSAQAKGRSKTRWIAKVKQAAEAILPPQPCFATTDKVAATIYYFATSASTVDVDNIIKPILDALKGRVYVDDKQIDRVVCQRFDPGSILTFTNPTPALLAAATGSRPVTFVRIHTNLKPVE